MACRRERRGEEERGGGEEWGGREWGGRGWGREIRGKIRREKKGKERESDEEDICIIRIERKRETARGRGKEKTGGVMTSQSAQSNTILFLLTPHSLLTHHFDHLVSPSCTKFGSNGSCYNFP
jgi:hypothetical protein